MNLSRLTIPQRISGVAILIVIIAAFLPWASVFGFTKSGISGDGSITLVLAILGLVLFALTTSLVGTPRWTGRAPRIVMLAIAGLVTLIALIDMNGFAAIGLYLTLFSGIAWLVGDVWSWTTTKQAGTTPTDAL